MPDNFLSAEQPSLNPEARAFADARAERADDKGPRVSDKLHPLFRAIYDDWKAATLAAATPAALTARSADEYQGHAVETAAAPFQIGDEVLDRRFDLVLTVTDCCSDAGEWIVEATAQREPGLSHFFTAAPATHFWKKPANYRLPPVRPLGHSAASLDFEAWSAKDKADDVDLGHQLELVSYHRAAIAWTTEILSGIAPECAAERIQLHRWQLDRCLARLRGEDPDVTVGAQP